MLIGEYEHTIDEKGRISVPSKLRKNLGDKIILTKGLDKCIFGFSLEEWQQFEQKLKTLPLSDKNSRNFIRFFLSGAVECELDKQGRLLLNSSLKQFANLNKEAVIVGVLSRIEIWDKHKWQENNNNVSADDIAENMTILGI